MYYEGLNSNAGLRVKEEDAFGYAMDSLVNDYEVYEEFNQMFEKQVLFDAFCDREALREFKDVFVDWFFSGDWLLRKGGADE